MHIPALERALLLFGKSAPSIASHQFTIISDRLSRFFRKKNPFLSWKPETEMVQLSIDLLLR